LDWSFGTFWAKDKGHEIWHMECEEPAHVRVSYDSSQGIS
jgi:hypothetical protein